MASTDSLYAQYKGTSIPSFDGNPANNGQCEQWYLMVRTKRDGFPAISGNAIDRWNTKETDKYDYIPFVSGVYPKKDDYVVWGSGVGSNAGHIDVCAQDGNANGFLGYDSNWNDIPKLTTIQHNYQFGILGYVRRKGVNMAEISSALEVNQIWAANGVNRAPNQAEVTDAIGRQLSDYMAYFLQLPFVKDNLAKVLYYDQDIAAAAAQGTTHDSVIAYIGKNLA